MRIQSLTAPSEDKIKPKYCVRACIPTNNHAESYFDKLETEIVYEYRLIAMGLYNMFI